MRRRSPEKVEGLARSPPALLASPECPVEASSRRQKLQGVGGGDIEGPAPDWDDAGSAFYPDPMPDYDVEPVLAVPASAPPDPFPACHGVAPNSSESGRRRDYDTEIVVFAE